MKRRIIVGMVLSFLLVPNIWAAEKQFRIAYVNFIKVLNEYKKTEDYQNILENKAEEKDKVLRAKMKELKEVQNKLSTLKGAAKKKEEEKFKKLSKEYRKLQREITVDLSKERNERLEEIANDIKKVIEEYAKKKGFDLVVTEMSVLYGDKKLDITDEILKMVNSRYKKK